MLSSSWHISVSLMRSMITGEYTTCMYALILLPFWSLIQFQFLTLQWSQLDLDCGWLVHGVYTFLPGLFPGSPHGGYIHIQLILKESQIQSEVCQTEVIPNFKPQPEKLWSFWEILLVIVLLLEYSIGTNTSICCFAESNKTCCFSTTVRPRYHCLCFQILHAIYSQFNSLTSR